MTSRSSQNCSLSAYSERLGWDWLVRDCLSASTHATREELGSGGGCPLWNFPVRRPLNVCTQSKCVLTYKLSHDCKNTIVFPSCYPFSGLHGNMATPSLLHTSNNSHSVERQRRLYCACKKQEIVLGYRELNVKLYWLQGVKWEIVSKCRELNVKLYGVKSIEHKWEIVFICRLNVKILLMLERVKL